MHDTTHVLKHRTVLQIHDKKTGRGFRAFVTEIEHNMSGWDIDRNHRRVWFRGNAGFTGFMDATVVGRSTYEVWDTRYAVKRVYRHP